MLSCLVVVKVDGRKHLRGAGLSGPASHCFYEDDVGLLNKDSYKKRKKELHEERSSLWDVEEAIVARHIYILDTEMEVGRRRVSYTVHRTGF